MRPSQHKAFTLIELLVVISIIALLSSVVLSSLNAARAKARDARRAADIDSLAKALSLYALDNAGSYPSMTNACVGVPTGATCWGDRLMPGNSTFNSALAPYMSSLPPDPLPDRGWGDRYLYLNGQIAIECNGSNLDTGKFIAFRPDNAGSGSSFACPGGTVKACCYAGPCNNLGGYYCARKIAD